jgi:hypothetical protein
MCASVYEQSCRNPDAQNCRRYRYRALYENEDERHEYEEPATKPIFRAARR